MFRVVQEERKSNEVERQALRGLVSLLHHLPMISTDTLKALKDLLASIDVEPAGIVNFLLNILYKR